MIATVILLTIVLLVAQLDSAAAETPETAKQMMEANKQCGGEQLLIRCHPVIMECIVGCNNVRKGMPVRNGRAARMAYQWSIISQ